MNLYFDKIIQHLNRKKVIKTKIQKDGLTEWVLSKPIIEISKDEKSLYCSYGVHYLYIYYDSNRVYNSYKVSIESECTFAREQLLGVKTYETFVNSQEDVIECIRYRLRK